MAGAGGLVVVLIIGIPTVLGLVGLVVGKISYCSSTRDGFDVALCIFDPDARDNE
jgi:hypothetical protein